MRGRRRPGARPLRRAQALRSRRRWRRAPKRALLQHALQRARGGRPRGGGRRRVRRNARGGGGTQRFFPQHPRQAARVAVRAVRPSVRADHPDAVDPGGGRRRHVLHAHYGAHAGKVSEAWGVLDWMLEQKCCPMVHTYTPIVQGYCREGRVEEAKEVMTVMERAGCPPNVVTYNVLIKVLCDNARFDEGELVLTESRTKGWKPSTVTYNTYMNGLWKFGMAEEALEQLDVMLGEGLDPTDFTFEYSSELSLP